MRIKLSCIGVILFVCFLSCNKDSSIPDSSLTRQSNLASPEVMSYHFGVEHLNVQEQVHKLSNLKMDGIILQIEASSLNTLHTYYKTDEVVSGRFHIYDIFTTISVENQLERKQQIATIESIYKVISNKETVLQVLFSGKAADKIIVAILSQLSDIARKYNKDLIIYPHEGLAIETAENALSLIKATNKKNAFLSLHLCHELAAGNGSRIEEVIKNVAPFIKSVSISGATEIERFDKSLPEWYWGIKPLYLGLYPIKSYYKALHQYQYKGPVAIHTWGIYENFGVAPEVHLPRSREILLNLADEMK